MGLFLKPNEKSELEIVRLARGGSAELSGQIQPGDIVFEVDHHDVYKKPFGVFVQHIQGPVGTNVEVKVYKNGDMNNPRSVRLERTLNPEDPGRGPPPGPPVPPQGSMRSLPSGSGASDIGIEFEAAENGCFQVTGMRPGGPAQRSGQVDIDDILYEIDGVKVLYGIGPNGRTLHNIEIAEMLRGPDQTVLNLRLQKGKRGRLAQVNLTREQGFASQPRGPPSPQQNSGQQMQRQAPQVQQMSMAPKQASAPQTKQGAVPINLAAARNYDPKKTGKMPDRFGLGLVFKSYSGQVRVADVLPDGPAKKGGADIQPGDWLMAIFNTRGVPVPIRGSPQPMATMRKMIFERLKLDIVKLRLKRPGQQQNHDVVLHKGGTGVRRENCHVGVVFHQDNNGSGWVRVKQVVPDSPAAKLAEQTHTLKVNDRVLEINGHDVAKKPLERWHNMLVGKEDTPCILTLADFYGKIYTCNIMRKPVGQLHPLVERYLSEADRENYINVSKVNPKAIYIAPPLNEKVVHIAKPRMMQTKKYICNVFGVTIGLSFVLNEKGEAVVDHVNMNGPARGKGILAGDVIHQIGDGPDVPDRKFPMANVYKKDVPIWAHIITEGMPETEVEIEFARPNGEKYTTTVLRELMVPIRDANEDLYSPGLYLSSEGDKIYVDKNGVVPLSSAAEQGVLEHYVLESINNFRCSGKPLDDVIPRMNEMLIGPEDSDIVMVFKTAAGLMKYNLKRDVPMKMAKTSAAKCEAAIARGKIGGAFAFEGNHLRPGQGVPMHPMNDPALWASLKAQAEAAEEAYQKSVSAGTATGSANVFQWRQRILTRTGGMPGTEVMPGFWKVEEVYGNGPQDRHVIYFGSGPTDTDEEQERKKAEKAKQDAAAAKAALEASERREIQEKQSKPAQREVAPAPKAPSPPPAAKPASPSPPTVAAQPRAVPADAEEDDEGTLVLVDGSTVPAKQLEVILKKHLDAVEHVMVVGSGKEFLSCMLTLKTKGSEAAARGEDPASLGPAKDELAQEALELAQAKGSEATTVLKARTCSKFRGEGLLPLFAKANAEIKMSAQQVRRFSILMKTFSTKTGEIDEATGELNRLAIKKQNKHIIEGMYQQKKAAPKP